LHAIFHYQKNQLDPQVSEALQRSGWEQEGRLTLQWDTHARMVNPSLSVLGSYRRTQGTEYRSKMLQAELTNTAYLTDSLQFLLGISAGETSYPERAEKLRSDFGITFHSALGWRLSKVFQTILDAQYIQNPSNVSLYTFSRLLVSGGVNIVF